MLPQQVKDLYFAANRWLVRPNTLVARFRYRRPDGDGLYLHVGCGETYIPGMINIDGNVARKIDLWLDLRNRLPFPDRSAAFIYCAHTLEHLFPDEAQRVLAEFCRVLRDDGVVRLATPDFAHALRIAAGHPAEDPQRRFSHASGQAIDYLFCEGQHKYAYSFEVMADFAREAGFTQVTHYSAENGTAPRDYGRVKVGDEYAGSLVVELRR